MSPLNMVDEFPEVSIGDLRLRRSAKWTYYDSDVLPAWVAEMDFPLADPVKKVLIEAVERSDTGYANPDATNLAGSYADFAKRHLDWDVHRRKHTFRGGGGRGGGSVVGDCLPLRIVPLRETFKTQLVALVVVAENDLSDICCC